MSADKEGNPQNARLVVNDGLGSYEKVDSLFVIEANVVYYVIPPEQQADTKCIAGKYESGVVRVWSPSTAYSIIANDLIKGMHETLRFWPSGTLVGQNMIEITGVVSVRIVGIEFSSLLEISLDSMRR